MNTTILRKLLIAGVAVSALSLAACGKKSEGGDDSAAAKAAAADASTVTDAASAKDQATADANKAAADAAAAPADPADTAAQADRERRRRHRLDLGPSPGRRLGRRCGGRQAGGEEGGALSLLKLLSIPESPQGQIRDPGAPLASPLGPGSPLRCGRDDKLRDESRRAAPGLERPFFVDARPLPGALAAPWIPPPPPGPLIWRDDGLPQSSLYGDVYFSSVDGLAETRAVFLAGCGLPERFAEQPDFTVGELGFGSGLNIAALLDLWRREKPPNGKLHIFSIEAHPLDRDEAARILAHWPELGEAAQVLLDHWPGRARGFHRIDLPGFDAVLDLAVMDVVAALEAWDGAADAWFLDGFSPALNPAMWRDDVLAAVASRSAPGARAATFTVAGAVRRGLQAAGFEIAKRPGFGRKRERLEAWLPGARETTPRPQTLAIIGSGIAGASLARAARAEGLSVTVIDDPDGVAASGNPAALVTPALDAGGGPRAALYAQAFARAVTLYEGLPGR
jgi:tRNA U34 5-methylaminomethyl-2-thiouridine-forming methyltransferase MnmC